MVSGEPPTLLLDFPSFLAAPSGKAERRAILRLRSVTERGMTRMSIA